MVVAKIIRSFVYITTLIEDVRTRQAPANESLANTRLITLMHRKKNKGKTRDTNEEEIFKILRVV